MFAVSRDLRDRAVRLGADPARVHVVYQGVEARFAPRATAGPRAIGSGCTAAGLVWVGRMDPVKGLEVLVDACARLRDGGTGFTLAAGRRRPGPAGRGGGGRPARLGPRRFTGMVPHDQLPDWYRAADLTVLSSYSEAMPNVLRESLACGTPYVSTRVGGVAELSDDPAVRLVPPSDPSRARSPPPSRRTVRGRHTSAPGAVRRNGPQAPARQRTGRAGPDAHPTRRVSAEPVRNVSRDRNSCRNEAGAELCARS